MQRALWWAFRALRRGEGGPFGAVVVLDGSVIGEGGNRVLCDHDPSAHAEVVAIRRACQQVKGHALAGATLYASCEPCPMCAATAAWARVGEIYFAATSQSASRSGFDDQSIARDVALPAEQRRLPTRHVALPDAEEPFEEWLRLEGRQEY